MWNEPSKTVLDKIPRLHESGDISFKDKLIYLHFFIGGCDWYIAEYDGEDVFFGFVILGNDLRNAEWGYVSFSELKSISIAFCEIDNDIHWKVCKASKIQKICEAQGWRQAS